MELEGKDRGGRLAVSGAAWLTVWLSAGKKLSAAEASGRGGLRQDANAQAVIVANYAAKGRRAAADMAAQAFKTSAH